MSGQLAFDLEALGLQLEATPAMIAGTQRAFQCAYCGTVIVRPSTYADMPLDARCPVCREIGAGWLEQRFPIAGLRPIAESAGSGSERIEL